MNCEVFAYDTSLHALGRNSDTVQIKLQKCINVVSDWCDKNAMILHPAKKKKKKEEEEEEKYATCYQVKTLASPAYP